MAVLALVHRMSMLTLTLNAGAGQGVPAEQPGPAHAAAGTPLSRAHTPGESAGPPQAEHAVASAAVSAAVAGEQPQGSLPEAAPVPMEVDSAAGDAQPGQVLPHHPLCPSMLLHSMHATAWTHSGTPMTPQQQHWHPAAPIISHVWLAGMSLCCTVTFAACSAASDTDCCTRRHQLQVGRQKMRQRH